MAVACEGFSRPQSSDVAATFSRLRGVTRLPPEPPPGAAPDGHALKDQPPGTVDQAAGSST
jgi:hypothetical protein